MTNMMRIRIDLPQMYAALKGHRLPPHASDDGYRVHAYLQQVFGGEAPTPFRIMEPRARELDVLAYSGSIPQTDTHGVTVASKTMPELFGEGMVLGFSLLACPVVRMASSGAHHKKGAEVDAFLRECWKHSPEQTVNRSEVYCQWLSERIDVQGGAKLLTSKVTGYRRMRVLRKTQGKTRKSRQMDKPAVDFEGTLEVVDSAKFASLIDRGIGRHRAFGFGMLLLRRPH